MKMESLKTTTTETFVEGNGISVTVNPWSNMEGVSFMVHTDNLALRTAASLRWEELDTLLVMVAKPRTVHRDGIHFEGLRFFDPNLAAYVGDTVRAEPLAVLLGVGAIGFALGVLLSRR